MIKCNETCTLTGLFRGINLTPAPLTALKNGIKWKKKAKIMPTGVVNAHARYFYQKEVYLIPFNFRAPLFNFRAPRPREK